MSAAHEDVRHMSEVMLAYANGADVQCRGRGASRWNDVNGPIWDWLRFEYRVKPKPRECWCILNGEDEWFVVYGARDLAEHGCASLNGTGSFPPYHVFHMREVTE